jgi:hypothetical protein
MNIVADEHSAAHVYVPSGKRRVKFSNGNEPSFG